jgi:hypothetical protein
MQDSAKKPATFWVLFSLACFEVLSAVLTTWIATQVGMIGFSSWLQPFHFCLGLAFIALPLTPSLRAHLSVEPTGSKRPSP